jgi:hypothetical protein
MPLVVARGYCRTRSFAVSMYDVESCLNWKHSSPLQIMQTFIQDEFRYLPGSSWVERGRYQVMSLANNRSLNKDNWTRSVTPGSKVVMSMVVRKLLESDGIGMGHCPQNTCTGKWTKPQIPSWATWWDQFVLLPKGLDWYSKALSAQKRSLPPWWIFPL